MDSHVKDYFRQFSEEHPNGAFHHVICLHDGPDLNWSDLHRKIPALPKGWYELIQLSPVDRIDMLRSFWLMKIPFCPFLLERLDRFFLNLDDIGVYLYQHHFDDPYSAELIYSLKNNSGFFRGGIPASEEQLLDLQKLFPETILPEDYMAFLRIHNGFSKASDTGIIPISQMDNKFKAFQSNFSSESMLFTQAGEPVDPKTLIPFYESFGMPFYQCFWTEWYPESEMGNVYYSGVTRTISSVKSADPNSDSMAFYTFVDWLLFYIETIT
jgi:hypothetical protein